jgi:hypothetical protein
MTIEKIMKSIAEVDAQLVQMDAELKPLRDAQARASELASTANAQLTASTAKRKSGILDFLMGTAGRDVVDAAAAESKRDRAVAEKARAEMEVAQVGAAEVASLMADVSARAKPLREQRDLLVRRAIRELAEAAAEDYAQALSVAAKKFAAVEAHAVVLREAESVPTFSTAQVFAERLSFGPALHQREAFTVPVWAGLRAFPKAAVSTAAVPFHRDFVGPVNERFAVDFESVLSQTRRDLFARGLR